MRCGYNGSYMLSYIWLGSVCKRGKGRDIKKRNQRKKHWEEINRSSICLPLLIHLTHEMISLHAGKGIKRKIWILGTPTLKPVANSFV